MSAAHLLGLRPAPRQPRGRIRDVRRETADATTLVITPARGFPRHHRAGQYVGVGVQIDGRWRWRNYSLTQPPGARGLSVTVKSVADGAVSRRLAALRPGDLVRLAAPRGDFVLPDPAPRSILFLTAGSGITPVMGMLRTLAHRDQVRDIVHVHSAPTHQDVIFGAELAALSRRGGYRLILRATRSEGRLDMARLVDTVPDWYDRHTWACGPAGMLADVETLWAGIADRLHVERFTAVRSAGGTGGQVGFARSGRSANAGASTSLLEAGEAAGVRLPFGCRMGICHTCTVSLIDGRVRDMRTGAQYEAGSRVQTCVCAADGDCVVDI